MDWLSAASQGGALAGFSLVAGLFWKLYREVRRDRDYWREKFMVAIDHAETGLRVAEAMVEPIKKLPEETKQVEQVVRALLHRIETESE